MQKRLYRSRGESMTDPERIEAEIDDISPEIEGEYGEEWDNLNNEDKEEIINNHFFIRNPNVGRTHPEASKQLRIALDAYRSRPVNFRGGRGREIRVTQINRNGKTYRVIRDRETGRIRQWVRE